MLTPPIVGERHYRIAPGVRQTLGNCEELKDITAMLELEDALEGCDRILNDEFSNVSEQSLYMIGSVDGIKSV